MTNPYRQHRLLWRLFLISVLFLLIAVFGSKGWGWALSVLGIYFYISGLSKNGNPELLFPGTILLVFGGALLLKQFEIVDFPLWRFWLMLFGGMGLGFVLMWTVNHNGIWVFAPGGLLLFISGGGFAARNFFRYQIWLRGLFDYWFVFILLAVLLIVISNRRKHPLNLIQ